MRRIPFLRTYKTKLASTPTRYMITPLALVNEHAAVGAAAPFLMFQLKYPVTVALVLLVHTLGTKVFATGGALGW